jgi:dTMP kinase
MSAAGGKLIALEGIDGAGTTTQAELLRDRRGFVMTREPSHGRIGRLIRELLANSDTDERAMALLFAADRLDHVRSEIWPHQAEGRHVVTDRYVLSSIAYQSVYAQRDFVAEINRLAPPADLTIFVRVPVDVAETRRARRHVIERYEFRELQEKIAANYEAELPRTTNVVVVDGTQSIEAVYVEVVRAIESCIGAGGASSSRA